MYVCMYVCMYDVCVYISQGEQLKGILYIGFNNRTENVVYFHYRIPSMIIQTLNAGNYIK